MNDDGNRSNLSDGLNDDRREIIRDGALKAIRSMAMKSTDTDLAAFDLQVELIEIIRSSRIGRPGKAS